jgi:hypothetical protein
MSLTREQWEEMWAVAKRLEGAVKVATCMGPKTRQQANKDIAWIKERVEDVIGQME